MRLESARVQQLERDLSRRDEELQAERFARENAELEVESANKKLREKDDNAKQLNTMIQHLSYDHDGSEAKRAELFKEKVKWETRSKELETLVRKLEANAANPGPSNIPKPTKRMPRTSSLTSLRTTAVNDELEDTRVGGGKVHDGGKDATDSGCQ